MAKECAIAVNNLHIRYRCIKAFSIKKSLFSLKKSKTEVFEAVRGVTFEVEKGEILGIVGKNGSGKSTMLKSIAGIFSPDEGTIDLKGNSVSLLSIGVGFQKQLTGRENILLSGMLLGFTEEEVRAKMEDIIEFAGLGKFIDMPVKKKRPTVNSGKSESKPKKVSAGSAKLDTVVAEINKRYGDGAVRIGLPNKNLLRVPTGLISLDIDLGGGVPVGRAMNIAGGFSVAFFDVE